MIWADVTVLLVGRYLFSVETGHAPSLHFIKDYHPLTHLSFPFREGFTLKRILPEGMKGVCV